MWLSRGWDGDTISQYTRRATMQLRCRKIHRLGQRVQLYGSDTPHLQCCARGRVVFQQMRASATPTVGQLG
eukprot:6468987-Amphidinium_carterae.1